MGVNLRDVDIGANIDYLCIVGAEPRRCVLHLILMDAEHFGGNWEITEASVAAAPLAVVP